MMKPPQPIYRRITDVQRYLAKHGFPDDPWPIFNFLKKEFGGGSIGTSVYPKDPGKPSKKMLGQTWTVSKSNGQAISVTISVDGKILERSYQDNGDVRISDVQAMLRGWFGIFPKRIAGRKKLDSTRWVLEQKELGVMDYDDIFVGWRQYRFEESEDPRGLQNDRDIFRHIMGAKKNYKKRRKK